MTDPDPSAVAPDASQPVESTLDQPDQPDQQPQLVEQQATDDDGSSQHQQQQQLPLPPPPFQPLFTLVTDTTSRATHHPRVHYIFSDDDPDILTDALAQYSQQNDQQQRQSPVKGPSPTGSSSNKPPHPQQRQTSSPAPPPPSSERAIVLDLVPKSTAPSSGDDPTAAASAATISGSSQQYEVSWASSLSADWAVVSAKLTAMPDDDTSSARDAHDDDGGAGGAQTQQRFMLQIEGVDASAGVHPTTNTATSANRTRKTSVTTRRPSLGERDLRMSSGSVSGDKGAGGTIEAAAAKEDYGVIVDEFGKRMGVLRKVLDAGLERQRKVTAETTIIEGGAGAVGYELSDAPEGHGPGPADALDLVAMTAADNDSGQQQGPALQGPADGPSQRGTSNNQGELVGD